MTVWILMSVWIQSLRMLRQILLRATYHAPASSQLPRIFSNCMWILKSDTIDTSPLRVCLTMYIARHPRQQIRPETLRSVDQRFLYQQIGPEKLLSLVDQCFLYLIFNLEEFPPNYLVLLSRQIRKQLLPSLPMVDICNLEETAVVEGIEMNDIWQSVRENRVADHVHLQQLSIYR